MIVEHKIILKFDDLLELLKCNGFEISEHDEVNIWIFDMTRMKATDLNDAEIEVTYSTTQSP